MKKTLLLIISLLGVSTAVLADYFPANQSAFYYRIGGGRNLPQPALNQTHAVNLGVKGNIGLGYHCGTFDPKTNITDTLNSVKDSIRNIPGSVMSQATGAIVQFPMYMLMRANPNLYNLLNNNLIGAQDQFSMQIKSCEAMQAEALKGNNPYQDWMRISVGNQWKNQMWGQGGEARQTNLSKAKHKVDKNPGGQGLPWVDGVAGTAAKPIYVIRDTAQAGFNVVAKRQVNDKSPLKPTPENARLTQHWKTPAAAAKWIVAVTGDQKIQTCQTKNCSNQDATPGIGILPFHAKLTQVLIDDIQKIVLGTTPLSREALAAISPPGVMISTQIIRALQRADINQQGLLIDKLASNIATTRMDDMANLAIIILQSGRQVPAIRAATPAHEEIDLAIKKIDKEMELLTRSARIREQFVTHLLVDILEQDTMMARRSSQLPTIEETIAPLQDGAVPIERKR